jgi:GcrA cell cycle regulator
LLPERPIRLRVQRKQLVDLTKQSCRFPYGDVGQSDFFFCGATALKEAPYCARHAGIAFRAR